MERLSVAAVRHPYVFAALIFVATIFGFWGSQIIEFDDGLRTAFVSESPVYRDFEENRSRFTQTDADIAVLFRAPSFDDPDHLERIRTFALEAMFAENVAETFSIFSLRTSPDPDGETAAFLPADLPEAEELAAILDRVRDHPLGGARLLSPDHGITMVLVTLQADRADLEPARVTLAELEQLAEDTIGDADMSASITGLAPLRQIVIDGMLYDMVLLNGSGIVFGSIVCLLALRRPVLAVMTGIPPAISLILVLGAMSGLGLKMNTLTSALPVLILVLSFADSLHLTFEVRRQWTKHATKAEAIASAARRIGPACVLTSFTTAIAFSALILSQSELIRSLGIAGALATLLSLTSVLVTHPLVFLFGGRIKRVDRLLSEGTRGTLAIFSGRPLIETAFRHPKTITIIALVALVVALSLFARTEPVYSFLENVGEKNSAFRTLREVEARLAPTGSVDIPVALDNSADGAIGQSDLDRIGMVHRAIEPAADGRPILSLDTIGGWVDPGQSDPDPDRLAAILDQMSATQKHRFVSEDGAYSLIRVFTSDNGAKIVRSFAADLQQAIDGLPDAVRDKVGAPTGLLVMSSAISRSMISHMNVCFLAAVVASGAFITLWFRNWRYGLVAMIPNVLPIAMVGAWLALSGRGIQFSSAIALTIAFGIAVDDTIHVLNRLRLTAPPGQPFDSQAIQDSMRHISPILIITTAVLSFGMLGTQISSLPTIAYFGALVIFVFVLALIAVLVVLPACLLLVGRRLQSR